MQDQTVGRSRNSVEACVDELRRRIRVGLLHPGEQIRQEALAVELQVSRTPLRQALNALVAEGLATHTPNSGYFVVNLSRSELREIYRIREVLERQLYDTLDFDKLDFPYLREIQDQLEFAMEQGSLHEVTRINREFHFAIFEASPLTVVQRFVAQAWSMSEGYRSIYVVDSAARRRVVKEHRNLLAALAAGDRPKLVEIADGHRGAACESVSAFMEESAR